MLLRRRRPGSPVVPYCFHPASNRSFAMRKASARLARGSATPMPSATVIAKSASMFISRSTTRSRTWKVFTLDLRYYDTDLNKGNCSAFTSAFTASGFSNVTPINPIGLGSNWCSAAFVAKLSADLTLGSLK